jgi:hypothetical protein
LAPPSFIPDPPDPEAPAPKLRTPAAGPALAPLLVPAGAANELVARPESPDRLGEVMGLVTSGTVSAEGTVIVL